MLELPFLNRGEELRRLGSLFEQTSPRLAVVYGRRRCGKSRLLFESLPANRSVYFFCDEREAGVQRFDLAVALSAAIPGFQEVRYPDWDAIFKRWYREAPSGWVLALDEFSNLVKASRELPSILQKQLDTPVRSGPHLVLCGSSQRMMQGLVLDRNAPLYGRAQEILRISPLPAGWLKEAFPGLNAQQLIEAYALWGGIPRYWELAREFPTQAEALQDLILSPLGVLHDEPQSLLQDDLSDTLQSSSLLQLIGQGCHRLTELSARLGKPSTSLNRPLQRLVELNLVSRQKPFGSLEKDSKRSFYRIADPFLRFWYRYVAPHRSRLQARQIQAVLATIEADFNHYVAGIWEDLVRMAVPHLELFGTSWSNAQPWWGPGLDRKALEIDVIAASLGGSELLIGSVKWQKQSSRSAAWAELEGQARLFPDTRGRQVQLCLFSRQPKSGDVGPEQVLQALR